MSRVVKRVALAVIVILALAFGAVWVSSKTAEFTKDRKEAEWISLTRQTHFVASRAVPNSWDIGLFVSDAGLDRLLALASSTTIAFDPKVNADEDTILTVRKLDLNLNAGLPTGTVELSASSKRRALSVNLKGVAGLVLKGIGKDQYGHTIAKLGIDVLQLEPELKWGFFSIGVRGYASELLTTGAAIALANSLEVIVPLPDRPAFDLSIDRAERVPVRDPKPDNWVDLATKMPLGKLKEEYSFGYPIFINGGVWFGADVSVGGQAPLEPLDRGTRTDAELDAEIATMKKDLAAVPTPQGAKSDVSVWFKGEALKTIASIGALPIDRRTATINSTGFKGRLASKDWNNKILGDGGAFVEFNKVDAVKATGTIDALAATWDETAGLSFAGKFTLKGKGDVHLHVDPYIGGGVGTDVGIEAEATADIAGKLPLTIVNVGSETILAFLPDLACNPIHIEAKSDGKLVLDFGWTKVPPLGAKVTIPGIASLLSPQIVFSSLPHQFDGRSEEGQPLPQSLAGQDVLLAPAWKSAQIALVPVTASNTAGGLLIAATLTVSQSADQLDPEKGRQAADALKAAFEAQFKPKTCEGDMGIRILLGDIEFGPNNEIIKFIQNAWNDITKGPGKNNEVVKLLGQVNAVAQDLDDASKQIVKDLGNLAQQAFPGDGAIAKAAGDVVNTVSQTVNHAADEVKKSTEKVITKPGDAIKDFGDQLKCGFC